MTYQETIDYLFSQLPMYQRQGKSAFKKDLTNIKKLCTHFDNPYNAYPIIHIAGTNGKGTVAHMLAAIFMTAGYKVGLYTSPHYKDFRERIKINGKYISKKQVTQFTQKVITQLASIQASFFEISVAMAFDHFKNEAVDIAIIETGLGGRLDSTNIITPEISVITNISFDHQDMLGNTLRKIAKEKAGIIKKNVPVVIGEFQEMVANVFDRVAAKKSATLTYAKDIKSRSKAIAKNRGLTNPYLNKNLQTAIAVIAVWNKENLGQTISARVRDKGLMAFEKISNYKGRWQVLAKRPLVIADSAHNEGGLSLLINEAVKKFDPNKIHFVFGCVKDKSLDSVLDLFPKNSKYYFCQAQIPRALPSNKLKNIASNHGLIGNSYKSVRSALISAKKKAKPDELIIICGSIFVVAEII